LDIAISQIKEFLLEFEKDSFGYSRFQKFLKSFMLVKDLKLDPTFSEDKHLSNLVFVYDKAFPEKEPIVYSSVNKAMKALLISHGTLMDYIANQYIFRNNLALSFEPISPEVLAAFSEKPVGDNLARREIIVFNENNELVYEFKSGREMARYFGIDGKVARSAILEGTYQNFTLVSKSVSYRLPPWLEGEGGLLWEKNVNGKSK
jgi:hypothetical protein